MSLQELNEKLHSRDADAGLGREQRSGYDPDVAHASVDGFSGTEEWTPERPPSSSDIVLSAEGMFRRRRIIIGIVSIIAITLAILAAFAIRGMLFAEDRVAFSVSGPQNVASAELVTYTFTYTNANLAALHDATLVVSYPDSFHPESSVQVKTSGNRAEIALGDIGRRGSGRASISGKFYGSRGELAYLRVTLRYTPSNTSATFEKDVQFGVNLASSPLSLEITAPLEMATGQDVEYVVDYRNDSAAEFSGIRLSMEYPAGFKFSSAEPRPSEGESVWYVGNLAGNSSRKVIIRGTLAGTRDEYKKVRGLIGYLQGDGQFIAYNVNERQTKMVSSPLSIYQTINGLSEANVSPGEMLWYDIAYRNDSSLGLRDAIITLEIGGQYVDISRLRLPNGGAYDASRSMIVWKASDVPALSRLDPGEEGKVSFSVPVKEAAAIGSEKNISIRSRATIDSPDVPTPIGSNKGIASSMLYAKLNAVVAMNLQGFYSDPNLPNSGPIPPVVGQKTTYSFHLVLENFSSDLTKSKVSVSLPTGVLYERKHLPESETISWNERTNELVWEVGTLSSGKKRELSFQISIIPAANQAGKEAILVNNVSFSGIDSFTESEASASIGMKTTFLREDPSIGSSGFMVLSSGV